MDLKKAVEKHPLTYVLSCIVAAVIVTAGVMGYFAEQHTRLLNTKHQSEVDELNSKLASIRRGIPGDEFFDVRKLIYSPNSESNMPPKSSVYFPEGFYATTSHGVWSYRQTTEWALICDIGGCSPKDVPKHIQEAGTLGKVHLWKTGNELSIEGHDLFKKSYPFICVEKLTFDILRLAVESGAKQEKEDEEEELSEAMKKLARLGVKPEALNAIEKEAVNAIEKEEKEGEPNAKRVEGLYRDDIIGAFFSKQLRGLVTTPVDFPNTSVSLVTLQKVGNVLYTQVSVRLKDVKVGGRPLSEFYITRELIIISTPDGAYIIQTFVPSEDPSRRAQTFAAVTTWLNDFRIVIP